jgi:hypothetical protein
MFTTVGFRGNAATIAYSEKNVNSTLEQKGLFCSGRPTNRPPARLVNACGVKSAPVSKVVSRLPAFRKTAGDGAIVSTFGRQIKRRKAVFLKRWGWTSENRH